MAKGGEGGGTGGRHLRIQIETSENKTQPIDVQKGEVGGWGDGADSATTQKPSDKHIHKQEAKGRCGEGGGSVNQPARKPKARS